MEKKKQFCGNWVGFLAIPVAFSVLGFLLIYFVCSPVLHPLFSMAQFLVSSSVADDTIPPSVFDTLSENISTGESIPFSTFSYPPYGAHYGEIKISGASAIAADLYYGDNARQLNAGVGTYAGGNLPGFGRTVMMAGHNTTVFHDLGLVEKDDIITVRTYYGEYQYKVTDMAVKDANDKTAYDFTRADENLVLYTCYPFDQIGLTPQRYFVYGEYLSGPVVDLAQ